VSTKDDNLVPREETNDLFGDIADLGALFATSVPVVGSAVSFVLSDWTAQRRYKRVREVLLGLSQDLMQLRDRVREEYVRSDEFVDLLDQTLRRVANERNEQKRSLYRGLLLGAIAEHVLSYDEQLHMLRLIDVLQAAHITLLRAILQEPDPKYADGITGNFMATLRRRLPDLPEERIADLVAQFNDHHVLKTGDLQTNMSADGAEDMRDTLAPLGKRLVTFLKDAPAS
jgi:hypothetical protein